MDAASAPGGPCPGEDTLLRYTQAALDASEHGPVASHVAGCERCRALVAALGTAPESDRPTERAPSRDVPAIGERVGKYRVERVLGAGGMGVVLAARHVELGSEVALKVMNLEGATSEDRARFAREARAAATLKSDHAARVHDVDTLPSGAPYMVMELLEGEDLAARVDRSGPLEPADVVAWMLQACDALAEAHERGVVHRDLKPQNLFLAERRGGAPPAVKVLDFGLAKVDDRGQREGDSLTRTSVFMGTPYYMAPEQVRSAKNVDARTDVWALGACMYTLLTGEPPFPGPNVGAICKGILEGAPRPLLDRRPDVSPGLARVVARCLEKIPSKRYADARALARALTGAVAEPTPRMPGAPSRASDPELHGPATMPLARMVTPTPTGGVPAAPAAATPEGGVRALAASSSGPARGSAPAAPSAPAPEARPWTLVLGLCVVCAVAGSAALVYALAR